MTDKRKTLGAVDFKPESHKFRKFLSIVLFIILLAGYSFLFAYNLYISSATSQIEIEPSEFEQDMPDNTTMEVSGEILIKNSHWNSIAICCYL